MPTSKRGHTSKFLHPYHGPFRLVRQTAESDWEIENRGGRRDIVNIRRIKPYVRRDDSDNNPEHNHEERTTTGTADAAKPCPARGKSRCAIYVKRDLAQAEVDVVDHVGGPFECCAVRVRIGGVDTTVASLYIRPRYHWDPTCLLQLLGQLGKDYALCGDMNAHHSSWGSRRCCPPGRGLHDVITQLGLQLLNTGANTFIRRGSNSTETAIDLSLATENCRYHWTALPDTWGSDHIPLLLTPFQGKNPRSRKCQTIDWKAFRNLMGGSDADKDFLQKITESAKAATIESTTQSYGQPSDDWMLSAVAMPADADARVGRVCAPPSAATPTVPEPGDSCGPYWQYLKHCARSSQVAVLLCISVQVLVERLAERFAERPPSSTDPDHSDSPTRAPTHMAASRMDDRANSQTLQ
ncbi:hypothetical protein MTO96_040320 [Rhipicephalus appendiculatus]